MNELNSYVDYLYQYFRNNQDPQSIPLRFVDLFGFENHVADKIYELFKQFGENNLIIEFG